MKSFVLIVFLFSFPFSSLTAAPPNPAQPVAKKKTESATAGIHLELDDFSFITKDGKKLTPVQKSADRQRNLEKALQQYAQRHRIAILPSQLGRSAMIKRMVEDRDMELSLDVLYQIWLEAVFVASVVDDPTSTRLDPALAKISGDLVKQSKVLVKAVAVRLELRSDFGVVKTHHSHLVPDAEGRPTVVEEADPFLVTRMGTKILLSTKPDAAKKFSREFDEFTKGRGIDSEKATFKEQIELSQAFLKNHRDDADILARGYAGIYHFWVLSHDPKLTATKENADLADPEVRKLLKDTLKSVAGDLDLPDYYWDVRDEPVNSVTFLAEVNFPQLLKGMGSMLAKTEVMAANKLSDAFGKALAKATPELSKIFPVGWFSYLNNLFWSKLIPKPRPKPAKP